MCNNPANLLTFIAALERSVLTSMCNDLLILSLEERCHVDSRSKHYPACLAAFPHAIANGLGPITLLR